MGKTVKVCKRGWENAQVFNGNGEVRACCWSFYGTIGNLLSNSMSEILLGERMEVFRKSLLNGTYEYCTPKSCVWMANDILSEHLIEVDSEARPTYPKEFSLSYEKNCNYRCTCCRVEHHKITEDELRNIAKIEKEVSLFLDNVEYLSSNGTGELFCSPGALKLLSRWKPNKTENIRVLLESNGSLFNETNWKKIKNLGTYYLSVFITVMSFNNRIYQRLSGTHLDISTLIDNLKFVKSLREKGIINELELATVVQEENFRDLPEFIERCINEFGADTVRIRHVYPYSHNTPEHAWFSDVRNPAHPHFQEHEEIMKHPSLSHPKVYVWAKDQVLDRSPSPIILNELKAKMSLHL